MSFAAACKLASSFALRWWVQRTVVGAYIILTICAFLETQNA
jgi:hypothetical protein